MTASLFWSSPVSDNSLDLAAPPADLEIIVNDARGGQKAQLRLWLRMLSITKIISHEIRRRLRNEFQATLPQFDLMAQLYREREGLRLGELSRRTMVTNGNVTGLADRLEADGLIVRAVERPCISPCCCLFSPLFVLDLVCS